MALPRSGFSIGPLHIVWRDLWKDKRGLFIAWGHRVLFDRGQKGFRG